MEATGANDEECERSEWPGELKTRDTRGANDEETETMDEGSRSLRRMAGWMENVGDEWRGCRR